MGHVVGTSRNQIEILSLDEMVKADSPARQIDRLIDEANTSYFEKSETKATGRRPFNPKDMLKLFVYGMDNGVQSSRKLERECKRNIEVMWLLNGLQPDDKTICNFRRENAENIARFFDEFCVTLAKAGYIDGKVVAIDGTKIRADNSKRNNFSAKKLDRHIEYINKKLAEYMRELDKNDRIAELEERKAKYEFFKERIESGKVTEVSTTDPDARLMKQGNDGVDVSYNIETAVDGKNKLVTGVMVTNEPNDQGQLSKLAKAVKENLGLKEMAVPVDKGFYDTEDIKECHGAGITTIIAKPDEGIAFRKSDFQYEKEDDSYRCPAGQDLLFSTEDTNGIRRYENRKACRNCPRRACCTKGVRRVITRHKHAGHAEQNDRDLAANPMIYKLRQQLCEHPFGTVKRTMGIRQFLTRGLTNVTAEAALVFLAYNLKRLRKIHSNGNEKDGQTARFVQIVRLYLAFLLCLENCPCDWVVTKDVFAQSAVPLCAFPVC